MAAIRPPDRRSRRLLSHLPRDRRCGPGRRRALSRFEILGEVYAAPYAFHAPESAFVVEDREGVAATSWAPPIRTLSKRLWKPNGGRSFASAMRTRIAGHARRTHGVAHSSSTANAAPHLRTLAGPSAHQSCCRACRAEGIGAQLIDRWLARSVHWERVAPIWRWAHATRARSSFYRRYGFRRTRTHRAAIRRDLVRHRTKGETT
jgi:hypothetical protein